MNTQKTDDGALLMLADLIEQWEKRAQTADKLANDAAGAGEWTTSQRCKTKAGVIRSMTIELKRAIRVANVQIDTSHTN